MLLCLCTVPTIGLRTSRHHSGLLLQSHEVGGGVTRAKELTFGPRSAASFLLKHSGAAKASVPLMGIPVLCLADREA